MSGSTAKKIADRADVAGAYRAYEFRVDVICFMKVGKNALAVEIFAPEKNDLGLTWVDWNPTPPDKDMGMWREVFLSESGEVALARALCHLQARLRVQIRRTHSERRTPQHHRSSCADCCPRGSRRRKTAPNPSSSRPTNLKLSPSLPINFPNSSWSTPAPLVALPDGRPVSLHRKIQRRQSVKMFPIPPTSRSASVKSLPNLRPRAAASSK